VVQASLSDISTRVNTDFLDLILILLIELSLSLGQVCKSLTLVDLVLLNVKRCYRSQVHAQIAKLKRELSAHESEALRLKSSTSH
jgi:hypothetical protein